MDLQKRPVTMEGVFAFLLNISRESKGYEAIMEKALTEVHHTHNQRGRSRQPIEQRVSNWLYVCPSLPLFLIPFFAFFLFLIDNFPGMC